MTTTKTTKKQPAKPATEAKDEAPKVERLRAADLLDPVHAEILAAGSEGISMKDLVEKTGIRYRVLHNVTYHLAKAEKIRRVGEGRKVVFASTEVKAQPAPRKRAPRKATAAKSTKSTTEAA